MKEALEYFKNAWPFSDKDPHNRIVWYKGRWIKFQPYQKAPWLARPAYNTADYEYYMKETTGYSFGRQLGNYLVKPIFKFSRFDCHLIWHPEGTRTVPHVDDESAYRINIILKSPKSGGVFKCVKPIINWRRVKIFKSSNLHSVTPVTSGERLVLSLGVRL